MKEDWKAAYEAADLHTQALKEHVNKLHDWALQMAKERNEWMDAYRDAMRPPRWLE
jgi:hypothetical protein